MKRGLVWVICGAALIAALLALDTGCLQPEWTRPRAARERRTAGRPPLVANRGAAVATCLSNLKQIAVAFLMYKEDYDG